MHVENYVNGSDIYPLPNGNWANGCKPAMVKSMHNFCERIVYTDNHLLVVNKPAGMLTQDSGSGREVWKIWLAIGCELKNQKKGLCFYMPYIG